MFNKNVIKLRDNAEYIKEAIDTIAVLYIKRGCNYKNNIPAYLKALLNQTTKIKLIKVIKLLYS